MKEEVRIPESLKPENIMDTIGKRQEKRIKERKKKEKKRFFAVLGAAAVFVCILAGVKFALMQELRIGEEAYVERDGEQVRLENIACLESYDQLYQEKKRERLAAKLESWENIFSRKKESSIKDFSPTDEMYGKYEDMVINNEGNIPSESFSNAGDSETKEEYSKTNVQTEGIDENDIVKTDGKYIYFINDEANAYIDCLNKIDNPYTADINIKVYLADGENSELLTDISLMDMLYAKNNEKYRGISLETDGAYLYKDTLILMAVMYEKDFDKYRRAILFIDVNDRKNLVITDIIEHKEEIADSRLYGDILYICGCMPIDATNRKTIPAQIGGKIISEKCVYMPEDDNRSYTYYTVIGSFDLSDDNKLVDSIAWLSDTRADIYMSKDSIYFYNNMSWSYSNTNIVKVKMNQGKLELYASADVNGYVYDQFAFDEYNGYLRVVTTDYANNLYVLDKNLQIVGKIENIAPGETIRSARYMGDIGYFVTFRQTDPLFSVDLSDPAHPQIIGALKIPGFSTYLHFIDENTLMGIGENDENGDGVTQGVKVSTFDISDPTDVKEIGKWVYDDGDLTYHFSHKAILAVPEKNLYGFGIRLNKNRYYMDNEDDGIKTAYKVMSYIDGKMREVESIEITLEEDYCDWYELRGVYIGEYLYVIYNEGMEVYPLFGVLKEEKTTCIKKLD